MNMEGTMNRLLMIWYSSFSFEPRFCSSFRSEAQKTAAKRAVGAILQRRHIHRYVEEQNRETSVAARIFKP